MALDGIVLNKIYKNLNKELPIRINRISEISCNELIFNVHHNKKRSNIIISISPNSNRINFTDRNYPTLETISNFTTTLRKKLIGGIIYEINQIQYDRFLVLKIKNLNELYDEVEYLLYIELMGKYANIILVDPLTMRIIDAFKKIAIYNNSKRIIQINAPFKEVEIFEKDDPFTIDNYRHLKLQGFSPLLEKELSFRLENKETFKQFIYEIKNSNELFCYQNEFHIIELKHLNQDLIKLPLDQGLDFFYNQTADKERIKTLENKIYKLIKKELKHFENKIVKISDDLKKAENYDNFKLYGDYLFMSGKLNQKGLSKIQTYDYDSNLIDIDLNPKLSIKENANKYYQKYQKLKKGITHLKRELSLAKEKLEYFKTVNEQIEFSNQSDMQDIKNELINLGFFKENNKHYLKKNQKKIPQLYKVEINEKVILFGKNNLQNAFLTFKTAKKDHYFFHAKDYHGAHVVINSNDLNEEELRLCAMIAGYYSGARNSSSIPIDYCLIKDIKKISGAKVSISNQKTIYIDIDYQILNKYKLI